MEELQQLLRDGKTDAWRQMSVAMQASQYSRTGTIVNALWIAVGNCCTKHNDYHFQLLDC